MRHPPEGQGQHRHRIRAALRLPVQPRDALPEGRQALPAGRASRPAAQRPWCAIRPRTEDSVRSVRRGDPPDGVGDPADPVDVRRRRDRRPERRQPDHGEDVPHGQVRPRVPEDEVHRLQRPALHGERRRGEQEGVRDRPVRQSVGGHPRRRGRRDRRLEHGRVLADHDELRLAGARERRKADRRRSAHHADRPHGRRLPAGPAGPRRHPLQRHPEPDDRERLARSRFHREPHRRLRRRRGAREAVDAARRPRR